MVLVSQCMSTGLDYSAPLQFTSDKKNKECVDSLTQSQCG